MPLSHYALDKFVSQDLSKLTSCSPQSLGGDFPARAHWLSNFVLRRIFTAHVGDDRAPLAFALIRRAEAALDEWELACEASRLNLQQTSHYFKALRHVENCVAALWQAMTFGRRATEIDLFVRGDASVYERLNWAYNKGRHFDPGDLPAGALHALWLTNDGLSSQEHSVSFAELRDGLSLIGRVAQRLAEGDLSGLTGTESLSMSEGPK